MCADLIERKREELAAFTAAARSSADSEIMPASLVRPHRLAAAARWHRTGRWTPQALAAALGRLEIVVKSSDNPHFMYVAEGRSDLLADGKRVERHTLCASEFFGDVHEVRIVG